MSTIAETDKRRERRSTERLEVQAAITCKVRARSLNGVAYDFSTDGCMIEVASVPPKAGDPIVLCFPGQVSIEGKVVWVRHRNAGIQFAEQLDRLMVRRIVEIHGRRRCEQAGLVETARYKANPAPGDSAAMAGIADAGTGSLCWLLSGLASSAEHAFFVLIIIMYSAYLVLR